jgi:hypothetical protein
LRLLQCEYQSSLPKERKIQKLYKSYVFRSISRIDKIFFLGKLRKFTYFVLNIYLRRSLKNSNYLIIHVKETNNLLSSLCDKFGSDKGSTLEEDHPYPWKPHAYANFYTLIFEPNRFAAINLFECGIGTSNLTLPANMGHSARPGASLRAWAEYFPSGKILGADIDPDIMFEENRIQTIVVDQTSSKSSEEFNRHFPDASFDIVIDDGLHSFEGNTKFFQHFRHTLKETGVWVIEDLTPLSVIKVYKFFREKYGEVEYTFEPVLFWGKRKDLVMNSLIVIRRKI